MERYSFRLYSGQSIENSRANLHSILDPAMFAFESPHLKAKHCQSDILFNIEKKTYIDQAKVQILIEMQLLVFQN